MQLKMRTLLASAAVSLSLLITTNANAALVSVLGGQAVNDTDLGITWLSNANLAATNTFGLATGVDLGPNAGVTNYGPSIISGPGPNAGLMTWGAALKWIGAMNAANYLGYSDWRLATTAVPDASCSLAPALDFHCTGSEMGHLFYDELGGSQGLDINLSHNANYNLFSNLQYVQYWSGTETADNPINAWYFMFDRGQQSNVGKNAFMSVMAVRSGLVSNVPVPASTWLFGSALIGLTGLAKKKKVT